MVCPAVAGARKVAACWSTQKVHLSSIMSRSHQTGCLPWRWRCSQGGRACVCSEVVVAPQVPALTVRLLHLCKVDLVAQDASHASKASAELAAFLGPGFEQNSRAKGQDLRARRFAVPAAGREVCKHVLDLQSQRCATM